jgi:hypothetical protein
MRGTDAGDALRNSLGVTVDFRNMPKGVRVAAEPKG